VTAYHSASRASADAARVVAIALTGGALPWKDDPASTSSDDVARLVEWLAANGWDADHLMRHRDETQGAGRRWPHPVPASARGGLGAAQATTLVREVIARLGLDHGVVKVRRQVPAGDDDRRLMAELPPHHGRVG